MPLAAVPVLLSVGPGAYAYWAASGGGGTGQVGTGSAVRLSVTADPTAPGALHPGSTSTLRFSVANPNPYPVELTTLTAATVSSSDEAGCPGDTLALPSSVVSALASSGHPLPDAVLAAARSTATPHALPVLLTLSAAAPHACQGVTFTVELALTGSQA